MPARGHGGHGGRGHGMHSHGIGAAHHRPHHPHPIGHQYPLHSRPMSHYHHGFHNHRHHHFGYRGGAMGGVMVPPRTRKAMITRTVIGGLVSTLIALPMIVVGALLIADIWKINMSYMGIILVATGVIAFIGGLIGLIMSLCGICGPSPVTPSANSMAGVPSQIQPYYTTAGYANPGYPIDGEWGLPTEQPYPAEPLKPPVYSRRTGPELPSIYQQPSSQQQQPTVIVTSPADATQTSDNVATDRQSPSHASVASPPPRYYSPSPAPNSIATQR